MTKKANWWRGLDGAYRGLWESRVIPFDGSGRNFPTSTPALLPLSSRTSTRIGMLLTECGAAGPITILSLPLPPCILADICVTSLTALSDFLTVVIITPFFHCHHYCYLGVVLLVVFVVADAALAAIPQEPLHAPNGLGFRVWCSSPFCLPGYGLLPVQQPWVIEVYTRFEFEWVRSSTSGCSLSSGMCDRQTGHFLMPFILISIPIHTLITVSAAE